MATTKPDYTYKWASDGDKIAPSNSKIQTGWSPEIPPYQWENWIQNRQDEMLAHINERGIAEWDNKTDYIAGKSYVQGSDGKVYKSVTASGPTTTVQDPTTDVGDTYWTVAFADVGTFLSQAAGDARYAQRANNLSDLTNAATARTNLGLGTAATKNAQTSPTDTTAGALMEVGAFGLGEVGNPIDDMDALAYSGLGRIAALNSKNTPTPGVGYGIGMPHATGMSDLGGQLFLNYANDFGDYVPFPRLFARSKVSAAAFGSWVEFFHSGNLPVTTFAKTLLDDADAAAARGTLDVYSKAEANGIAIGVGQTWQDVTRGRVAATTYTNTTGRSIQIFITFDPVRSAAHFSINGVNILPTTDADYYHVACIVPAGSTYRMETKPGGSPQMRWMELR